MAKKADFLDATSIITNLRSIVCGQQLIKGKCKVDPTWMDIFHILANLPKFKGRTDHLQTLQKFGNIWRFLIHYRIKIDAKMIPEAATVGSEFTKAVEGCEVMRNYFEASAFGDTLKFQNVDAPECITSVKGTYVAPISAAKLRKRKETSEEAPAVAVIKKTRTKY